MPLPQSGAYFLKFQLNRTAVGVNSGNVIKLMPTVSQDAGTPPVKSTTHGAEGGPLHAESPLTLEASHPILSFLL